MEEQKQNARRQALADAIAGVAGSLISLWVFYPIDVFKTRRAAGGPDGCSHKLLRAKDLYAGWHLKTLHTTSSSFCYFYLYSWIISWWTSTSEGRQQQQQIPKIPSSTRLLLSAAAALINTFVTLPLDGLSSRQQMKNAEIENRIRDHSVIDGTEESVSEESISLWKDGTGARAKRLWSRYRSLFAGLLPSLLLCSNPAIHYTVFDTIKFRILSRQSSGSSKASLSMAQAFVVGLVSKLIATIVTYPLIRAKIMIMVTSKTSMFGCLFEEYNRNGPAALYQGCHLQLLHTLLKSAVLMMVRERITRTTRRLILPDQQLKIRR